MEKNPNSHLRNNNDAENHVLKQFPYKDIPLQKPITVKAEMYVFLIPL